MKDGTVYEAFRSKEGQLVVVDTLKDRLPVTVETVTGVKVARVDCGDNCYIFDQKMLRAAVRDVLDVARSGRDDLVLDLSRVSFVEPSHLNALRHVHDQLRERGRELIVISRSTVVARDIALAVPELDGAVFRLERDAVDHARRGRVIEATG
ncbi:MAG: hypothetical protein CL910_04165 [Deltaproteobacteria bacterium]|nr:hypothetical protein [Deltaproteobacteria bacterium]